MKHLRFFLRLLCLLAATGSVSLRAATDPVSVVPINAPRTLVLASQRDAFRTYCTSGEGARAFARIRADLDRSFLNSPLPAEPVTYGDPSPSKRTSDKADLWRAQQDVPGRLAGIAGAAAPGWLAA